MFIKFLMRFSFLLCLSGCSSVRVVETKAEEGFQLSDYKTFNFYQPKEEADGVLQQYEEELEMIKAAIASRLEEKGLSRSQDPELLLNIGAVVEEKTQTRETNIRDAPRYIGQRRYTWQREEIVVQEYKLGTVTVEFVDKDENMLVWRGVARGVVPEDQEELQENIEEGVEKLFQKIPK